MGLRVGQLSQQAARLSRSPGPKGDRIVILEDSKGTGKADKATVFYQAPEFLAPLGIAVAKDPVGPGYKVFVCQSPDILVFEDKDGDGKADGPPKKLLTGFGGFDHDHGVHGILIGPDMQALFHRRRHGRQRTAMRRQERPDLATATTPIAGPAPSGAATSTARTSN